MYDPIFNYCLFQVYPKLTRLLFRFKVTCREGILYIQAYKCGLLDFVEVVVSATVCLSTDRSLDQAV